MYIKVLKSKIHNAIITEANVDYIGSITIDERLMKAANLIEGEQVHVLNHRNGERLITYVIKGECDSGTMCMNGPAALKIQRGDKVIVISYASMQFETAKTFQPNVVFPDSTNRLLGKNQ